jgi:hypothetical protein
MGKEIIFRCIMCRHYYGYMRCSAFREKIPVEIYAGYNEHAETLDSQKNDIVFERLKKSKRNKNQS